MRGPEFIIYAPQFRDTVGGIVVLHLLCARLNEAGCKAAIWPDIKPIQADRFLAKANAGWILVRERQWRAAEPFGNPIAHRVDIRNAVVVYPETVEGNPLGASNVVRWLLHKPGFHTNSVTFGKDDLFFHYQDAFNDPILGDFADNRLTLTWWNKEYRMFNDGERSGTSYLMKKGKGSPIIHDLRNSVLIDPLTHPEKAAAFNRTRCFYTYDPYTLYSRYAALCGCIPIIVPQPGMTREQWVPCKEERYGLAYGEEDIEWAITTRPLLLQQIAIEQATEADMLHSFIQKCQARAERR